MYKVIVEKDFKNRRNPSIATLIMVKNEEARILVSIKSVENYTDAIIIYDTGSTDNTIETIKNYCEERKISHYIIQGEFVDFSVSRNVMLDYADTKDYFWQLLLDCNDELKNGEVLLDEIKNRENVVESGFHLIQSWKAGHSTDTDIYKNVRLIKARNKWRYKGVVHEYITCHKEPLKEKHVENPRHIAFADDRIVIFQDRIADNHKSAPRFKRDKELLYKEFKENPNDGRTLYYLAQTCSCLRQPQEAIYYSKLCYETPGFYEERFHSAMRIAENSLEISKDWFHSLEWYNKALHIINRAEPYIKIAKYYDSIKRYDLAFNNIFIACQLDFPYHLTLHVDKIAYFYERWHLLGRIAFYVGKYEEGIKGCVKAIAYNNSESDKKNLEFYKKILNMSTPRMLELNDNKTEIDKIPIVSNSNDLKLYKEIKEKYPNMSDELIRKKIDLTNANNQQNQKEEKVENKKENFDELFLRVKAKFPNKSDELIRKVISNTNKFK